jgi:uncharacterized membrane protein YphA (DoxX/SURF4 family)
VKLTVNIARILTGILFIFSRLVKAIDPLGLAYKMQEFFEAWADSGFLKNLMGSLNQHALAFSIMMITLEVVVGVALLLGWQKKFIAWVLVLLMLFFTFLTSYVLFSGKIRACGCFGDCIPLTPLQTFTKDIILLLLSVLILVNLKYITPLVKPLANTLLVVIAIAGTLFLQSYVLKHLPLRDCLPYKQGNNLLELRKMPVDAIQDKFDYKFVYEKGGEKKEFAPSALPDSSWKFLERKQVLVAAGKNNVPLINDFSLSDENGIDLTDSILSTPDNYYLLFMKELPNDAASMVSKLKGFTDQQVGKAPVFVITSQRSSVLDFFKKYNIIVNGVYTTDGTAIKTAARVNPTIFYMKGPVVEKKQSWIDFKL